MSAAALAVAPTRSKAPATEPFKRRRAGYTPLDHREVFYNLSRLTAGKTQLLCILYVLQSTAGASRAAGESAPVASEPISTEEFAWFCGEKNLRTIQMALEDLCERKVLLRKAKKRGEYVYSAPVASWEKLASFSPPKKTVDSAESLDESGVSADDEGEEQANLQRRKLRLNSLDDGEEQANLQRRKLRLNSLGDKPLDLAAGRPSKALALEALVDQKRQPIPIEKVQFDCDAPAQVDPIMHRGILRISIRMGSNDTALVRHAGSKNEAKTGRRFNAENCVERNGVAQNKEVSDALAARGAPMEAAISGGEMSRRMSLMRDALNRWFRQSLGPVDDTIVRKAVLAQGAATDPDVFAALKRRAGVIKGWGLVVEVIGDAGRAAAKAGHVKTGISRPGQDPESTDARIEARKHADQLHHVRRALEWLAQDPNDKDGLEILKLSDPDLVAEARAGL